MDSNNNKKWMRISIRSFHFSFRFLDLCCCFQPIHFLCFVSSFKWNAENTVKHTQFHIDSRNNWNMPTTHSKKNRLHVWTVSMRFHVKWKNKWREKKSPNSSIDYAIFSLIHLSFEKVQSTLCVCVRLIFVHWQLKGSDTFWWCCPWLALLLSFW